MPRLTAVAILSLAILLLLVSFGAFVAMKARVARKAEIVVPFEHMDHMRVTLEDYGVKAWCPTAARFGGLHFYVSNTDVLRANESAILDAAFTEGYFCGITYIPEWEDWRWGLSNGVPHDMGLR